MYTRDPFDVPTPRQPRPETPSHIKAFYSQLPDMRPTYKQSAPATYACRFNPQKKQVMHVHGFCPHFPEGGSARTA